MACEHCGAPDETDYSAESQGLVLKSVAARQAGRSRTWIESRTASGELQTEEFAGRRYVVAASLRALLSRTGMSSQAIELDRLLDSGNGQDAVLAQELHRRMYPQQWAAAGTMPRPQSNTVDRGAGDAADAFLRKYGV